MQPSLGMSELGLRSESLRILLSIKSCLTHHSPACQKGVCVCVCVCVRKRQRDREPDRPTDSVSWRQRGKVEFMCSEIYMNILKKLHR